MSEELCQHFDFKRGLNDKGLRSLNVIRCTARAVYIASDRDNSMLFCCHHAREYKKRFIGLYGDLTAGIRLINPKFAVME